MPSRSSKAARALAARVAVPLSPERLERARTESDAQTLRYATDDGSYAPYRGDPKPENHFQSTAAREAVAQYLGLDRCPKKTVRVRYARYLGTLLVAADAPPGVRWVLVTGRAPEMVVVGWLPSQEAPTTGAWRGELRPSAWSVAPDDLYPPATLRNSS